jgi:hypothetical protein
MLQQHTSPPATLAEFILVDVGGLDFSDKSLFDVYNMPIRWFYKEAPTIAALGCVGDSLSMCPLKLKVTGMDEKRVL